MCLQANKWRISNIIAVNAPYLTPSGPPASRIRNGVSVAQAIHDRTLCGQVNSADVWLSCLWKREKLSSGRAVAYVSYNMIRLVRACTLSRASAILVSPNGQGTGPKIHVSFCKPKAFIDISSDFERGATELLIQWRILWFWNVLSLPPQLAF
jgi:hypothetical protein